jgi:hypothetical protein
MVFGRLVGWLMVLCGIVVLGRDLLAWFYKESDTPIVFGKLWYDLNPGSLQLLQPAIQRHIHPALWDWIVQPLLLFWAFPTLMVAGSLLILVCRPRRDRARRRWRPE